MTTPAWLRALACTATLLIPLALAQPASLALPPTGAAPSAEVRDTPGPRPDTIDLGAIEDAALAQADRLPPATWEVPALALELAFDLPAMHAFVRDHVAFDPYAGVLRGAQGTLSARAGNAWDRALLLHALVTANDYEARFAFGTLDDSAVAALLAAAPAGAAVPLDDPPGAEVLAADLGRIADRARRDHALLLDALGAARSAAPTRTARRSSATTSGCRRSTTTGSGATSTPPPPTERRSLPPRPRRKRCPTTRTTRWWCARSPRR
jgi:hypothetical protein